MADITNNAEDLDKGEKSSGKGTQKLTTRIKNKFLKNKFVRTMYKGIGSSKVKNAIPPPQSSQDVYYQMQAEMLRKQEKAKNKVFNFGAHKRAAKIVLPFLVLIVIIIVVAYPYISHSPVVANVNSYMQIHYGSTYGKIGSLFSSLWNSVVSGFAFIENPFASQIPPPTITNATPTFTSFLALTVPSNQYLTLTGTSETQSFEYSVKDTSNVPLGSGTPNNVLVNMSCGNTYSKQATTVCEDLINTFEQPPATSQSFPPVVENVGLIKEIFPTQQITNSTLVQFKCPSSPITFPTGGSLLLNFTVFNYSTASIMPLEFVSQSFDSQLISSSPLIPSQPSISFTAAGPVQVKLSTDALEPILTKLGAVPISLSIGNSGTGGYHLNSLSLFISTALSSSNPATNPSNGLWTCQVSSGMQRQNFVFPSGYWNCTISNPALLQSSSNFFFTLPALQTLNGLHFDTIPVLAYANYNYIQQLNIPFVVQNQTTACG